MIELNMMTRQLDRIKREGVVDIVNNKLDYCLSILKGSTKVEGKELEVVTNELEAIEKFLRMQRAEIKIYC